MTKNVPVWLKPKVLGCIVDYLGRGPATARNVASHFGLALSQATEALETLERAGRACRTKQFRWTATTQAQTSTHIATKIDKAVKLLVDAGWTCIPPLAPESIIPEPKAGETWVSPNPRIEPRIVIKIGPSRGWPEAGDKCVFYTARDHRISPDTRPYNLKPEAWRAWARKSGARPAIPAAENGPGQVESGQEANR